ncbi:MAG TPA: hypothetical protein VK808_01595 [Bacteroidia bacterium]|jgi:hypothetical protein|nr:hypothetical protein [Bacteroidia bacterium]
MYELLAEIKSLQSKGTNKLYPEGVFPSQRKNMVTVREDDNSFFTALIVFTLLRQKKYFSDEELKIVEEIKQQAKKAFPLYENKNGKHTYNFWRTEKNAHFPNGNILSKFDFLRLADDVDCTALVYLASGYSENEITYLKDKLLYHSTLPVKVSKNTLPHYKNLKLYSTWFGKYIPIETDICVIANLLYLLFESNASFNNYDLDCIKFVCSVIINDEHKTQAIRVAPYYPKTSIIIYHVARLLTVTTHPDLLHLKVKLKADIFQYLSGETHPMEKIVLNTSLMWLGETDNIDQLEMPADNSFPWFIAGMLTSMDNQVAKWLAPLPIFHIQFFCAAYMKTLFLEYKMEKGKLENE